MRVLITGMTPTQSGRPGRFEWVTVPALFADALRAAGHHVEHRPAIPNEDLTPYDAILVGLVPPGSIAARHTYVTMDVICRAKASGAALMFYVDDWQFDKIVGGCKNKHKNHAGLYTTIKGRTFRDWAETDEGHERVALAMEALATRPWPATLSVAYPWGDHSLLENLPAKKVTYLDPSGFCVPRTQAMLSDGWSDSSRERSWILAGLSDQRGWIEKLGLNWPVELIGPKSSGAAHTLKEHEVVKLVQKSWGTLCPSYQHAGSGWWRSRYLYTSLAGAIMVCGEDDGRRIGDAYLVPPGDIEKMSVDQLIELRNEQSDQLFKNTWSKQEMADTIETALADNLLGPVKEQSTTIPVSEPQPVHREHARRDDREFDTTSLRERKHGERVHRDYAAHYFRWGWATRLIGPDDHVLDVGCGPDLALPKVLAMAGRYVPASYTGVDLNRLSRAGAPAWATLHGDTNIMEFTTDQRFTKIVCFEVIEHMSKTFGVALLEKMKCLLEPNGELLLSTPVFNGKAAVNHVYEWMIDELNHEIKLAGFQLIERYGTFASYPDIKKVASPEHLKILEELRLFYSDEVTANFLAPLYPDHSRNNVWLCRLRKDN